MLYVYSALRAHIRMLRPLPGSDRGETGPIGYAFMVSAIVLLAIVVAAWGQDIANALMAQVDEAGVGGDGGGDGGE